MIIIIIVVTGSCSIASSRRSAHLFKYFMLSLLCLGITYGEPHLVTPDGFRYVFNGLGEYWLVQSDILSLQGRTGQAMDANNQLVAATVFKAFAAIDLEAVLNGTPLKSSRVLAQLLPTGGQFTDFSIWFNAIFCSACYIRHNASVNGHHHAVPQRRGWLKKLAKSQRSQKSGCGW